MASALYPKGKEGFLGAEIDLTADTIKVALIDTGVYTFSTAHDYFNDVSGIVGTPGTIENPVVTNGIFDGDDVVFSAVTGNSVEAIVIYKDTGTSTTSPLIAYIDGISVTPDGSDIIIQWDNGANKIFAL